MDDEVEIRRYMSFDKFYSLLHTKMLFMPNTTSLGDLGEGTVYSSYFKDMLQNNGSELALAGKEPFDKMAVQYAKLKLMDNEQHRKSVFISSWTKDEKENFGLWKNYLGNQSEGVCIVTTNKQLIMSIDNSLVDHFRFGEVLYHYNVAKNDPYFEKDEHYDYEKEYRAVFDCSTLGDMKLTYELQSKLKGGVFVDVNLQDLILGVTVSPFAKVLPNHIIESLLQSFDIDAHVVGSRVREK